MENSLVPEGQSASDARRKALTGAIIALSVFCGLSLLSRLEPTVYLFVVGGGLVFPLIWGVFARDFGTMGFTRRNLGRAGLWGLSAGLLCCLYNVLTASEVPPPPMLGLQLVVGIPIALLVITPYPGVLFQGLAPTQI
jgi:hypothetical protein